MVSQRQIEARLLSIHTEIEDAGLDKYSLELTDAVRDIRCAATEEINVTSWDDFQRFWERNRGQQLVFILIDQYGPEHPIVDTVKSLVTEANELDKKLHDLYMQMKGKGEKKEDEEGVKPADKEDADAALKTLEDQD